MIICLDWDGTLVDTETQEWLPGAIDALRWLRRNGHRVIIHSARARSEWGTKMIREKLGTLLADVEVAAKPQADLYLDDRAVRFDGDWVGFIRHLRRSGTA